MQHCVALSSIEMFTSTLNIHGNILHAISTIDKEFSEPYVATNKRKTTVLFELFQLSLSAKHRLDETRVAHCYISVLSLLSDRSCESEPRPYDFR